MSDQFKELENNKNYYSPSHSESEYNLESQKVPLIDIESNCCTNNDHINIRRNIINISIIVSNLCMLAGVITLLIKSHNKG